MDVAVIKVYDSVNSLDFEIPISKDSGSPLSINKSLSDLTNLTKRTGVKTIRFKVDITKELAQAYDNFNSSLHNNHKDVDADKEAAIIINGNEEERGLIRMINFANKDTFENAQLLFIGNNFAWTELIKNYTAADLTWTDNTFTYTPQNIKDTWTNSVDGGDEYTFPLDNTGARKYANMVTTEDFRPAFFFHSFLTRAFAKIGYTFTGSITTSTNFKKLVLGFWGERFRILQTYIDANRVAIGINTEDASKFQRDTYTSLNGAALYLNHPLNFGNENAILWDDTTSSNTDESDNFDPTAGTPTVIPPGAYSIPGGNFTAGRFTAPRTGNYKFSLRHENFILTDNQTTTHNQVFFQSYLLKYDSSGNTTQNQSGYTMENQFVGSTTGVRFGYENTLMLQVGEITMNLLAGESVELWSLTHDYDVSTGTYATFNSFKQQLKKATLSIDLLPELSENTTFDMTDVVDDQIKILDILNDFSRTHNIFWDTDNVLKQVKIETRDDFYSSIANAVDFTDRINLKQNIKTTFNSLGHKKQMVFRYAKDSSDVFVSKRDKEKGTNLAEYTHNLPSKFKEGTTTVGCKVLAATYYIKDVDSVSPLQAELAPYTSRLWNEYIDSTPLVRIENNLPRLLNYNYSTQNGDGSKSGGAGAYRFRFYGESTDRTIIPYVLPHQIELAGTVVATAPYNLFWHTHHSQDGLFTTYWSKTVTEIINGTNVMCYIHFNSKQWIDFKFSDVIYFDKPLDLKGYWLIEKLENYQPVNTTMVKCKLLKRIEYDVQVEGTTVAEDVPIGGTDSKMASGATIPALDGKKTSLTMTITTTDGDGNSIEVPMTTQNLDGSQTTMKI